MPSPIVTVLMSVYNGARYIRDAVDSILNQTFKDYEFIIIDDGSSDETNSILKSYADSRIRFIRNEINLGLANSLNSGIQIARGEFIARQDADDISEPQRLEKQVAFLNTHPEVAVLGCTTVWIDKDGHPIHVWRQPTDNMQIQHTMLVYCCLIHGSVMVRSRIIRDVGGYDPIMRTGQDYDLWLRISETSDIASLPEPLYWYRRHAGMASIKHEQEQRDFAQEALCRSVERRLRYANLALSFRSGQLPANLRLFNRTQLARRYVWWSSGAREINKNLAYRFLLVALLLNPATPDIWIFLRSVISHKVVVAKKNLVRHRAT